MMDYIKAISLVKKYAPDRTATACCDYDQNSYIVSALLDPNIPESNDPFYKVDKKTGAVTAFSPAGDITKFGEAMRKRLVYLRK